MYYHYSVQHEAFVWRARQEPGVLDAFSLLWGTDKLIASFDGINFTLPTSARAPWKAWPHIDQSPYRTGLQCAQGIINFSPNGPKDGGLVVLKGSHKLTESYFECHEKDQKTWGSTDWFGFTPEQVEWFKERGCEEIKVCADPGDLIVWDSRTMHHNVVPEGDQTRALVCEYLASVALETLCASILMNVGIHRCMLCSSKVCQTGDTGEEERVFREEDWHCEFR